MEVELSEKEKMFLELYKHGHSRIDIREFYGDLDNYPYRKSNPIYKKFPNLQLNENWWRKSLDFENINAFLSFLSNPKDTEYYRKIDVSFLDGMIDMIKSLIDVASRSDGRLYTNHRVENINNINDYNGINSTFKSTSKKSYESGETKFFETPETVVIYFDQSDFCPYINVERLIASEMGDEGEVLLPPFLQTNLTKTDEDEYYTNYSYTPYDYDPLQMEELYTSLIDLGKSEFVEEFTKFNETGEISNDLSTYAGILKELLKGYANKKYTDAYNRVKEESFQK